jgi:hypothetical protein
VAIVTRPEMASPDFVVSILCVLCCDLRFYFEITTAAAAAAAIVGVFLEVVQPIKTDFPIFLNMREYLTHVPVSSMVRFGNPSRSSPTLRDPKLN